MSSWFNWVKGGPSAAEVERDERRRINESVANTGNTVSDMEKKRNFLQKRADKLNAEGRAAALAGDEELACSKAEELAQVQSQIQNLNGILLNVRATQNAMDQTAINVNAFHIQKDAAQTLQTVNAQISVADVDQVHADLEQGIDDSQYVSKMMAKPITRRRPKTAQSSSRSMVDQWKMDAMKTPATKAGGGGGVVAAQPRQRVRNNNNNNNNEGEEEPLEEKY